MKNLARGSVLLVSLVVLIGFLFYFQPTAEAVTIANDSQETIKQENIEKDNLNLQNFQQTQTQDQNPLTITIDDAKKGSLNVSEGQTFRATAYCLKGRTATGGGVRRGIVAADRRVLPLGTRINISAGSYSGTYTVADTGGAVRGRILDIWVPSCSEANKFGRRTIKVSVMGR
ncbi:MAG TPA: 3D domain-containing protein [Pyrinomonadaceae bacterium]|jgi:3D (Asp-Asp-Asp) domain-containing protein